MNKRKIVKELIDLQIKEPQEYSSMDITFGELMEVKGVLDTDKVIGLHMKQVNVELFFSYDDDDDGVRYVPSLRVQREREETDEEFLLREKGKADRVKIEEEKEKLEYLRLKAKYE